MKVHMTLRRGHGELVLDGVDVTRWVVKDGVKLHGDQDCPLLTVTFMPAEIIFDGEDVVVRVERAAYEECE